MNSPAKVIFSNLHLALIHIAPERKGQFENLYSDFAITYIDSHAWILDINTESRSIRISIFVAEFLWSTAYANLIFYTDLFQGTRFTAQTEINLRVTARTSEAMDILGWAVEKLINRSSSTWPTNLPKPVDQLGFLTDEDYATEIALASTACLIHHELSHIALSHSGPSDIDIERDADAHSWDWILGPDPNFEDNAVTKRLLSLTHAYSMPVILDIHAGRNKLLLHPRSIDRLSRLFKRFNTPESHIAVSIAFATLYLHLENSPKPLPIQGSPFDSFMEALDGLLDYISTFPTNNSTT